MRRIPTELEGPILLEAIVHGDERGFFAETYRRNVLADLGIADDFVQDNHSRSGRGVLRGLHYQPGMAKLVRCARGAILDVVVDIRPGSESFGAWEGHELSDDNARQLYVPDGFGHGFCVLSDIADVVYRCSAYYDAEAEAGFAYDDPDVAVEWPRGLDLVVSERDRSAPRLAELGGAPSSGLSPPRR
jgi:dTDP-4-dehydrorhamnose 3,5-epimerase